VIYGSELVVNALLFVINVLTETDINEDIKEGSIILSNGNYTAGVLQVYYNYSWVDVCSSITTAHVACRQLGFYSVLGVFSDLAAIG